MSTTAPRLTRCESCSRVFDIHTFNTGDAFSCHCGGQVVVREPVRHDSPVIRCSSCGGSRAPNAKDCTFCGASFTLRERQLTGMCGHCGARSSSGDHYCHACGSAIVEAEQAAHPGEKHCPVCDDHPTLTHRQLLASALLECIHCGGVWLDRQAFAVLAANAREEARKHAVRNPPTPVNVPPQPGPAYRRCIECETIMQRKNYGRKSGVIVDVCPRHGIWFDLHELEQVLAWLRAGGVEVAEPKQVARTAAIGPVASVGEWKDESSGLGDVAGFVRELVDLFFFK